MKTMVGCAVIALIVVAAGYAPSPAEREAPKARVLDEVADLKAQIASLREELRVVRSAPASPPQVAAAPRQAPVPAQQATTQAGGHWERRTTYGLFGRSRGSYYVWVTNQTYSSGGGCASGSCRAR